MADNLCFKFMKKEFLGNISFHRKLIEKKKLKLEKVAFSDFNSTIFSKWKRRED